MSDEANRAATWGRIGGLRAWALNDAETMVGPAHRGFAARFERLVDPTGTLDPRERATRADRARRAHMLTLAAKSAEVRRTRKGAPAVDQPGAPTEVRHAHAERPDQE